MSSLDFLPHLDEVKQGTEGLIRVANVEASGLSASTLDEPVWDTVKRDLRAVWTKLECVAFPKSSRHLLQDWDLWGPLFICVMIAVCLHSSDSLETEPKFTQVFVITWFGSFIVTLNTKLLGGTISVFQTLCVLGYCLLPLAVNAILCNVISLSSNVGLLVLLVRLCLSIGSVIWAVFAANTFLTGSYPEKRKGLVMYPVCLFYVIVAGLILAYTSSAN